MRVSRVTAPVHRGTIINRIICFFRGGHEPTWVRGAGAVLQRRQCVRCGRWYGR